MKFIFAGTAEEALHIARRHRRFNGLGQDCGPIEWSYISENNVHRLQDIICPVVWIYGTWQNRKDANRVLAYLRLVNATFVEKTNFFEEEQRELERLAYQTTTIPRNTLEAEFGNGGRSDTARELALRMRGTSSKLVPTHRSGKGW